MSITNKSVTRPRRAAASPRTLVALCILLGAAGTQCSASQQGPGDSDKKQAGNNPVGAWRGQSKCVVRPSGCNDEDSLYRITSVDRQDRVHLSANKIVDGREVNMGAQDCRYDAQTGAIDCPLPNGNAMHLEVKGTTMEGKMTLADGTLWRKISLRKVDHE